MIPTKKRNISIHSNNFYPDTKKSKINDSLTNLFEVSPTHLVEEIISVNNSKINISFDSETKIEIDHDKSADKIDESDEECQYIDESELSANDAIRKLSLDECLNKHFGGANLEKIKSNEDCKDDFRALKEC